MSRRERSARLVAAGLLVVIVGATCDGPPPAPPDFRGGTLPPCPADVDCVHTGLRRPPGTEGMFARGSVPFGDLVPRIREIVEALPGAVVVTQTESYLHAEFPGWLPGRVVDLQLLVGPTREVVVRAAPRRGSGRGSTNVERVEELRRRLAEAGLLR